MIIQDINFLIEEQKDIDKYLILDNFFNLGQRKLSESEKLNQLKKAFKFFFPKTSKLFKDGEIIPQTNVKISKSDQIVKYTIKHLKGINIKLHTIDSDVPNAFTFPALSSSLDIRFFSSLGLFLPVNYIYFIYGYSILSMSNISAKLDKNGIVIFNFPDELNANIYQTTAFVKNLSPRQAFSVYLHELGHWVEYRSSFTSTLFRPSGPIFWLLTIFRFGSIAFGIFISLFLISAFLNRINEIKSDTFVKSMGYHKELAESLYIFHGYDPKNLNKYKKDLETFGFQLSKILHNIFSNHPHLSTRIKKLEESNLILEDRNNIFLKALNPFFHLLDTLFHKMISQNRHLTIK